MFMLLHKISPIMQKQLYNWCSEVVNIKCMSSWTRFFNWDPECDDSIHFYFYTTCNIGLEQKKKIELNIRSHWQISDHFDQITLDWNDHIVAKLQPVSLIYPIIFYNRDVCEFPFLTSKNDGLHNFFGVRKELKGGECDVTLSKNSNIQNIIRHVV